MDLFKDKKAKNDIILIVCIIAAALVFWAVSSFTKTGGAFAVVTVNGKETARYPLDKDAEITIESENGGYNILVIKTAKQI